MNPDEITYLDSSAIVKLIVREPETDALLRHLTSKERLVSSALARAEVMRAVLPLGAAARRGGRAVLRAFDFVRISDRVLSEAGTLEPRTLRTLDAIHVATAALFSETLAEVITYDERMGAASEANGMTVSAPA
jgi:predicted nucleic acid-binding protein